MNVSSSPLQTTHYFTISTAGHVDHGKTSLIKALTGIDPDRLKEEKERQMTTDLGFAYLRLSENIVVGFVDVPGHGKFLKNMLAGVGGIDMALLVVAADEGPMPQTRQHVRILSLLGVTKAVVAVTKIDLVDDAEQIDIVNQEVQELLDQHEIELLRFCLVSSTKRHGFDELKQIFLGLLKDQPRRDNSADAFLPIDRVFSKAGFGTVITGTLVKGKLSVGEQVIIGPGKTSGRIRRLETHGDSMEVATAGQRVACNLVLKDNVELGRGEVVLSRDVQPSKLLFVSLMDRPRLSSHKLSEKLSDQPVRLYHGTAEYHGFIRWVEPYPGDTQGGQAVGMIALSDPAVVYAQDRFVVRMSDETIYGGAILFKERPRWLKRQSLVALSMPLSNGMYEDALVGLIDSAAHKMIKTGVIESFLPEPLGQETMAKCLSSGKVVQLSEHLTTPEVRSELSAKVRGIVQSSAGEDGLALETLRAKLSPKLDRPTFQKLIEEEEQAGKIVKKGDKLFLPGVQAAPSADPAMQQLQDKILGAVQSHFCLDLTDLVPICGSDQGKIKTAAQALSKAGRVILISYEFVITEENMDRAHEALAKIWTAKRNIAPGDFREELNTSRKYAMALLQYFDDQKITRRLPNGRVLLKAPQRT